jgi:hypothetical protein
MIRLTRVALEDIETRSNYGRVQPFDCLFLFMNPNDNTYEFVRTRKVSFYHYNDVKRDVLHKKMPCAQLKSMNVTRHFPRYVGPFQTSVILEGRNIVYAQDAKFNYLYDLIIQYFSNNFEYVNFFERYYRLHPRTSTFQSEKNAYLVEDRSNRPVLEQFDEMPDEDTRDSRMVFRPQANTPGTLIPEENTFVYPSDILLGTPLAIGDHVVLGHQTVSEEDGHYIVKEIDQDRSVMERKNPNYPVQIDEDDETYFCVTNPSMLYKHECLSPYDKHGFPKRYVDIWDGPCKSSLECPFFRYDNNSKQFEGKCVNGYCSMPRGYTRIGFKKFISQDGDQWLNIEPRPRKFAEPSTAETRW